MDGKEIKELSKYRFEKAQANIETSRFLFKSQNYAVALNRAYYAAFDAMRAINALDGFDSSKHSGVIAHFNQNYVKSKLFPIETSSIIRKASMLREKSDYEDFYQPSEEEAIDVIEEVESFLGNVKKYLIQKSVLQ